jgi:hypothetical protein
MYTAVHACTSMMPRNQSKVIETAFAHAAAPDTMGEMHLYIVSGRAKDCWVRCQCPLLPRAGQRPVEPLGPQIQGEKKKQTKLTITAAQQWRVQWRFMYTRCEDERTIFGPANPEKKIIQSWMYTDVHGCTSMIPSTKTKSVRSISPVQQR